MTARTGAVAIAVHDRAPRLVAEHDDLQQKLGNTVIVPWDGLEVVL